MREQKPGCRKIRQPEGLRVARPSRPVKDETAAPRLTASLTGHAVRAVWKRRGGRAAFAGHFGSAGKVSSGDAFSEARYSFTLP